MYDKGVKSRFLIVLFSFISILLLSGNTVQAETVGNVRLSSRSGSVVIGDTVKLKVSRAPGDARISYRINKKNFAEVSKRGEVTGKNYDYGRKGKI